MRQLKSANCGHVVDPAGIVSLTVKHVTPTGIHAIKSSTYCMRCAMLLQANGDVLETDYEINEWLDIQQTVDQS